MEFTRVENEEDVHFEHKKGFIAKTSASETGRLKELLEKAWMEEL
jgi:hypothetical protein